MSVFLGVVMLLAFLIAVFVIFRGVSPIIVLLLLAIAWPLLAGSSFWDLLTNVLQKGGVEYASTIVIIVFGAWFGQVLVQTGIAESMIRTAVELGIFKNFFKGIEYGPPYFTFYLIGFAVYLACGLAMSAWNLRGVPVRRASAVGVAATPRVRVPWISYLAPAIPVVVIIAFKWPLIPAFLLAIVFALGTTQRSRSFKDSVAVFHKAFYDAFPDIATIAALWIVCGMLIVAGQLDSVKAVLNPVFSPVIPHTPFQASLFFALLAPLAIYRGPFSVVGTGAALLAVMLNANYVSPIFLYLCWRGPLCLQGSQDPTNSWTLWTIGYTKISHAEFLKTALPWGWLMVAINAFIAYFMFGSMFAQ